MQIILFLSEYLIPLIMFYIVGFGILSGRPVFDDFINGAKEGMKTVAGILPTLIGLMMAVGILRASGFLDFLGQLLETPAAWLHLPPSLVPLTLVRLISNSAALSLVFDIFKRYGVDSSSGLMASIMMSCTETVLYSISVYFGYIKITKSRWTLAGALFSTFVGVAASVWLAGFA